MTLNPAARRREHDFAAGLEGLAPLPGPVAALIALRTSLEAATAPRPEFRDALRQRLVAVATVAPHHNATPVPVRSASSGRVQRRMVAATGGLAAVVAVSGIAVAGDRSLPGEAFYGVKRAGEQVQIWAARGDASRGEAHLAVAGTRLDEASALARGTRLSAVGTGTSPASAGADGDLVAGALVDMDEHFRTGSRLLVEAWRAHRDDRTLAGLNDFSDRARNQLTALLPSLPAQAQPQARASLALLSTVGVRTDALLRGICGPACASVEGGDCTCAPAPVPTGSVPAGPGAAPATSSPVPTAAVPPATGTPTPGAPSAPRAPAGATTPGSSPQQEPDAVADLLDLLAPSAPAESPPVVVPPGSPSVVVPSTIPSVVVPSTIPSVVAPSTIPSVVPVPGLPTPLLPLAPVTLVPPAS